MGAVNSAYCPEPGRPMTSFQQPDGLLSLREKTWAGLVSVAMLGATLSPLIYQRDGFPLSNYPMFSTKREVRTRVFHVVGRSADGSARPLEPALLGTDEVMQAHQVASLAARSTAAATELCTRVATVTARSPDYAAVTQVELRVDTFDSVAYWEGKPSHQGGRAIATCPVVRSHQDAPR